MTNPQPRRLCAVCFAQYAPEGAYKCDDCSTQRTVPNRTKRQAPTLNFPELLAVDDGSQ